MVHAGNEPSSLQHAASALGAAPDKRFLRPGLVPGPTSGIARGASPEAELGALLTSSTHPRPRLRLRPRRRPPPFTLYSLFAERRTPMLRKLVSRRALAVVSGSTAVAAAGGYYYLNSGPTYPPSTKETRRPPPPWTPPSRQQMLDALKASGEDPAEEFDLLIVGGGATGAGVAVDAASRGLKVALVERDDFSSGES